MSYKRTVTCSHCWKAGHNRSGCSELREKMQERLKDDPEDWYAKDYFETKARSKKRACGYCRENGHTRPTCKYLIADKKKTIHMNQEWRQNALDFFKNLGLGVGALVQVENKRTWDGESEVKNMLVTEVLWDKLTFLTKNNSSDYGFRVRPLEDFSRERYIGFPMDPAGIVSVDDGYGTQMKVLGPVSCTSIESNVPDSWLQGKEGIDKMFVDRDGKQRLRYHLQWLQD